MAHKPLRLEIPLIARGHPHGSGWWGMIMLIATESALFVYLLFSYYYLAAQIPTRWPPGGPLDAKLSILNTVILLSSSFTLVRAERAAVGGKNPFAWLITTILLGTTFVGIQAAEWTNKAFTPSSDSFGSLYYVITGFHMAHVVVGLLMLCTVLTWLWRADRPDQSLPIRLASVYWHFVDAVWLAVFFSIFIFPTLV